jgi:hypothetical protein
MTFAERLGEVLLRAAGKLPPEAGAQLLAMISKQSLEIMAGVFGGWVVGHAFGYGEAIDLVVGVVGAIAIGLAVFTGLDELFLFARETYYARDDRALDLAADHLAKAIAILGIQVVLVLLFKTRPKGGRLKGGPPGPKGPGLRYKPTVITDPSLPAGNGATSRWGDITVSTHGDKAEQAITLLHERVHQFLTPKLYVLRNFRVYNMQGSYFRSSLYRYIEEALAETIGQVGVNGFSKAFVGLAFPVKNGYVYLAKAGGFSAAMRGAGVLRESAGLIASGIVMGFAYELRLQSNGPPPPRR